MSHLELYRDDLLNRFAGHTFTETVINSMTLVEFKNGASEVVISSQKQSITDAYQNIHHNLIGTFAEALPRITTTQRDNLTDPDDGLQIFETTADEVQVHYEGEFETVGGGEWKTRSAKTVQTTDDTETTIDSFTLDDEETYMVQVFIVATQSDGSERCGVIKQALLYRDGGAAIIQGTISESLDEFSDSNWEATITVSGNDVRASVTGVVATTINWKCTMQFIEQ